MIGSMNSCRTAQLASHSQIYPPYLVVVISYAVDYIAPWITSNMSFFWTLNGSRLLETSWLLVNVTTQKMREQNDC